ncbi:flagellar biosynthesis protein FlhF [Salinicola aestuarinus]|uniref:flagellar biosynthesis protein FlhF n=1 Tax=Salinicola aestuarinus TaxID=1949082 RepID=UPI000DA1F1FA|nr:flagellar biosynthesis protein FlhF [Salinicola aestuarinus]
MGVQRFIGANTREAMRQVRLALGEDVLILSNRVVDDGVEIVAMSEQAHEQALEASPTSEAEQTPAGWETFNQRLLEDMRALLQASSEPLAPDARDEIRIAMHRRLRQAGFSATLSDTLLDTIPDELIDAGESDESIREAWLVRQLAARLDVLDRERELFEEGGVFALVGPTGAGKTTTTAKLASRYVMQHGPKDVALVTTDSYRIGAAEQLRIYARLLGAEVHALDEQGDLGSLLTRLAQPRRGLMSRNGGKRMMVIDTVGMSQRDQRLMGEVARLGESPVSVRRVLVLDAARHGDTLEQIVEAWQKASIEAGEPLWGCILTKLDEAARLGPVLDVLMRHGLKLCYLSRGQRVPEDLEPVALDSLLAQALGQNVTTPFSEETEASPPPARARQQALSLGVLRQGRALETTFATLHAELDGMAWLERAWASAPAGDTDSFAARMQAATDDSQRGAVSSLWWPKSSAVRGSGQAMAVVALGEGVLPQPRVWPRHTLPAGDDARFDWAESLGVECHLLSQLPAPDQLARLDVARTGWLATVGKGRRLQHAGESLTLAEAMRLGERQPPTEIRHRGQPATLELTRLETTLPARRGGGEGLPVVAWQGVWFDVDEGRQLGVRYWIASARTGLDMASRLITSLTLETLPTLTAQADRLVQARRPELEDRAHRWQLAAALAALSLRLAQEEGGWAMDVRARLGDIAQRRCARKPKALLEALMDALSAQDTLRRARSSVASL